MYEERNNIFFTQNALKNTTKYHSQVVWIHFCKQQGLYALKKKRHEIILLWVFFSIYHSGKKGPDSPLFQILYIRDDNEYSSTLISLGHADHQLNFSLIQVLAF